MTNDKQREILVEKIMEAALCETYFTGQGKHAVTHYRRLVTNSDEAGIIADYILAYGVIVPKCKVGDKVYLIDKRLSVWWQGEVIALYYAKSDGVRYAVALEGGDVLIYDDDEVFSTRKEAEKALGGVQG